MKKVKFSELLVSALIGLALALLALATLPK